MNEILMSNARLYASRRQLGIGETLGSGKDGIVMVGKLKAQPAKVAIKALRWTEAYHQESPGNPANIDDPASCDGECNLADYQP